MTRGAAFKYLKRHMGNDLPCGCERHCWSQWKKSMKNQKSDHSIIKCLKCSKEKVTLGTSALPGSAGSLWPPFCGALDWIFLRSSWASMILRTEATFMQMLAM